MIIITKQIQKVLRKILAIKSMKPNKAYNQSSKRVSHLRNENGNYPLIQTSKWEEINHISYTRSE